MGLFSSIKHAFQKVEHGVESVGKDIGKGLETAGKDVAKVAEGVAHGVEQVGKTLAQDVAHVAESTFQAADALIHGHVQQALNKAIEAGQDLVKSGYDVATAGEQATVKSLGDMHLSKKMDNAMQKAEGGMTKLGTGISTATGTVMHTVANDAVGVAKDAGKVGGDVIHGHWQQALNDTVKTGQDAFKTGYDLATGGAHVAVNGLADANFGKGFDKVMNKVGNGVNSFDKDVVNSVDQVSSQVVNSTEGAVKGTVLAAKDVAQGHFGAAAGQFGNAAMDAVNVAADLTPEGAAASVGTQFLMDAHIGGQKLDEALGSAASRNVGQFVKGAVKNVAGMEVDNKVNEEVSKVLPQGSGDAGTDTALAGTALALAGAAPDGLGKRSRGGASGQAPQGGQTTQKYSTEASHEGGDSQGSNGVSKLAETHVPGDTGTPDEEAQKRGKKKDERSDNAQDAAGNTAQNQAAASDSSLLEEELMLQGFMLQAGMQSHKSKKGPDDDDDA